MKPVRSLPDEGLEARNWILSMPVTSVRVLFEWNRLQATLCVAVINMLHV